MYIDTHCHIDFDDFNSDRKNVIENAAGEGVFAVINVGTDVDSSRNSLELADKYSVVKAAVGIHPSEVKNADSGSMKKIAELAKHDKVVGIGETGLDFHYARDFDKKQKDFLVRHIQLAGALKLPLIVHQRDSRNELIEIFEKEKLPEKVVFHCFGGDKELAEYCSLKGFYVSFTGIITFERADEVRKACRGYPCDRIMAETDAPFLSPVPYRGKRNEPSRVRYVVEKISVVRNEDLKTCSEKIFSNSRFFFNV
ncbi:MAG TPA: TatD family hydrolase [bacterium]|nr:TatD family hydrolase [bacterium]